MGLGIVFPYGNVSNYRNYTMSAGRIPFKHPATLRLHSFRRIDTHAKDGDQRIAISHSYKHSCCALAHRMMAGESPALTSATL
jgi:hypothetical protein